MALQTIRIGGAENIIQYDDADFPTGVESSASMASGSAPINPEEVLRLTDIGTLVGDVSGPASATDNAIARFDLATGKLIQNSSITISDAGDINLAARSILGTSVDIDNAEMQQLSNIGAATISSDQWGYLGACGAGGGQLLAALTADESTQLEAIGAVTITNAQWGYLGSSTAAGGSMLDAADAAAQLVLLTGQADASFSWNSQNLTSVGTIGCGTVTTTGNYILADTNYIGILTAERVEFYAAGYVAVMGAAFGVGIASPTDPLHVYHATTDEVAHFESGDATVILKLTDADDVVYLVNTNGVTSIGTQGSVHAGNANIDASGQLVLGATSANATLDVVGTTRLGDSTTNYVAVSATGDLVFVGGSGLVFGCMHLHDTTTNVDISAVGQGTPVKITGLSTGLAHNVTINSDAFNVDHIGVYKVDWQISGDSQGNNKTYDFHIYLNNVEQDEGSAHREFGALGSLGSISGTAMLDVTDTSHDIDLRVTEPGGGAGTDFDIDDLGFNILQIGGT